MLSNSEVDVSATSVSDGTIKKLEDDRKTILEQSKIISELKRFNELIQAESVQKEALFNENNKACYAVNQLKTKQLHMLNHSIKLQIFLLFIFIMLVLWVFFSSGGR